MNKRGQVTIFIVIGIIILVSVGFLISSRSLDVKKTTDVQEDMTPDINSVNSFVDSCIKQVLEEGIDLGYICNTTQLENYMDNNLRVCTLNNFDIFEGLNISEGKRPQSNIILTNQKDSLIIDIDYPLILRKFKSTSEIEKFHLEYELEGGNSIGDICPEEIMGSNGQFSRSSIALDYKNQPHIVVNEGFPFSPPNIYMYNRINGLWNESLFSNKGDFYSGAMGVYHPHISIDSKDRAWIGAMPYRSGDFLITGQAVWLYENMSTNPSEKWYQKFLLGGNKWTDGNLVNDKFNPDEGVMMTLDGVWGKVDDDGNLFEQGQWGSFNARTSETLRFKIGSRDGQAGVWHAVHNVEYHGIFREYKNSFMTSSVIWNSMDSGVDNDGWRSEIGTDLENPEIAYLVTGLPNEGIVINVWNGTHMVYDHSSLPIIDPDGSNYGNSGYGGLDNRFGPQWTPAIEGGAFLCWTDDSNNVKLIYINSNGDYNLTNVETVGVGNNCAMATDSIGFIHMVYNNNGMRYRVIITK
jgi:hypothetical protein